MAQLCHRHGTVVPPAWHSCAIVMAQSCHQHVMVVALACHGYGINMAQFWHLHGPGVALLSIEKTDIFTCRQQESAYAEIGGRCRSYVFVLRGASSRFANQPSAFCSSIFNRLNSVKRYNSNSAEIHAAKFESNIRMSISASTIQIIQKVEISSKLIEEQGNL